MYEGDQITKIDDSQWEVTLPYQGKALVSLAAPETALNPYGSAMYRCDCNRVYCRHIMAVRAYEREQSQVPQEFAAAI